MSAVAYVCGAVWLRMSTRKESGRYEDNEKDVSMENPNNYEQNNQVCRSEKFTHPPPAPSSPSPPPPSHPAHPPPLLNTLHISPITRAASGNQFPRPSSSRNDSIQCKCCSQHLSIVSGVTRTALRGSMTGSPLKFNVPTHRDLGYQRNVAYGGMLKCICRDLRCSWPPFCVNALRSLALKRNLWLCVTIAENKKFHFNFCWVKFI